MNKPVLSKKDLRNTGLRWMVMPVSVFNYETQLAPAVVWTLAPALRKIYQNDDDYQEALLNHFKYYNSQPYMSAVILGAALSIEDTEGIDGKEAVQNIKTGLMGPLAGIGDTVFWILFPTIFGSIAAYSALEGNPVGIIVWIIYDIILFCLRWNFMTFGYNAGQKIFTKFNQQMNIFTEAATVLGLCVVGALVPSVITATVPLAFTFGEVTTNIQDLLNSVMPSIVPVALTALCYKILGSKKVKMTYVILIVLVLSILCSIFNILG